MCGIVGYTGFRQAPELIVGGLIRLEYRGYDSAGVAAHTSDGLKIRKVKGSVKALAHDKLLKSFDSTSGIGHTRWATHGGPSERNAHPHTDQMGRFAVVHNGVIENAEALRTMLERKGYVFTSETDTEVLAHLLADSEAPNLQERLLHALHRIEGPYGVAVMDALEPGKIVVARNGSPVLIALGDGEFFVASDAAAVMEHSRSIIYLEDGDIAVLTPKGYEILDFRARVQKRPIDRIDWEVAEVDRGAHAHFMHKEIAEQPRTVMRTLKGRVDPTDGTPLLGGLDLGEDECRQLKRIIILGCGTSWHAGLVGRYAIEQLARIPVTVEYASEFRYQPHFDLADTLTIAISQSGETADTLEAARAAKAAGSRLVGLVNVVGSTLAREACSGMYLHAGPEIGVASTKAFTSQVSALLLLAMHLGRHRGLAEDECRNIAKQLFRIPQFIHKALGTEDQLREIASELVDCESALYLGRGISFPVALEGALKLKEISYIHAEGYPAAEMKHGPIALIEEGTPVVFIIPSDNLYAKSISNMQEVKARGGKIIAITTGGNSELRMVADHVVSLPFVPPLLSPLLTSIPLQLLAYHVAVLKRCDVDRPRNLAKSVTVE